MSFSDLPSASKVVCLCGQSDKESEKPSPDPRLVNWEKWMTKRKESSQKLAKALNRHTEQLLCNYSEDLRTINEEKAVLENTKIIYPHDRYRGNPSFWNLPVALHSKPCQPDYFAVMTSAQKCEIPTMEYITVPAAIRSEKNTENFGYRNEKSVWDASEYRKERIWQLKEEIKIVEPFKPDLNLMVQGVSMIPECDACFKTEPDLVAESTPETTIVTESNKEQPSGLHDNEDKLFMDNCRLCNHSEKNVDVHLSFDYDITTKRLLTKNILITNGTSYALRYSFTRRKKFQLFHDIVSEAEEEQVFFYDKRELTMLPFDVVELPISFQTNFPSTYTLQLEMHIRPKLWNHTFVIHLTAVATYGDLREQCARIRQRIESEATKVIARDTIQDILNDIPTERQAPVFYIYDKPTIFHAVNQTYTPITRHPKYVYNKDIIEELEAFYLKVRSPDSPPFWNLNIEDLRAITKTKQDISYQEKILDELLGSKDASAERRLPKHEVAKGSSSMNRYSSHKSIKSKTATIVLDDYKPIGENFVAELENILLKLQHFTMWFNKNKTAFESCYSVICTAFDVILKEVYQLETDLNIQKIEKYPDQFSYAPHTFESRIEQVHEDLSGQPPRIEDDFIKDAQPAAECLKNISLNDSATRYKTYYGIVSVDPATKDKKDKGKQKKEKKDKKEKTDKKEKNDKKDKANKNSNKKEMKSNGKEKSEISADIDLHENPNFNIDAQPSIVTVSASSLRPSINEESSEITSELLLKEYKRSLYNIFYRILLESIVKLVDVIEIHKHEQLRADNIKRMLEETSLKEQPVKMRVLNLKEVINTALNIPPKYHPIYSNISQKIEIPPPKFEEPSHIKEEGSQWSILKPCKMTELPSKPISYPETNIYIRKKLAKRLCKDVGTLMSDAGIDPNWTNFKDTGVQVISRMESRPEKEEFISNILDNIMHNIPVEDSAARIGGTREDDSMLSSTEKFFCCDEIPKVLEKPSQTADDVRNETA